MSSLLEAQKFSNFVNSIVDRKIRAIALGITTSTGYFKQLIAEAAGFSAVAAQKATDSQNSANASEASSVSTALIYNAFTSTYVGILTSDPQRSTTGQFLNRGAFYVRSGDRRLRVATDVTGAGVVTWADATVSADPGSILTAGAGVFLALAQNIPNTPQIVTGRITFQNIISVLRVSDWASNQPTTAFDVKTLTDTIIASISSEVTRATTAEQANAAAISTANSRAIGVETTLRTDLTAEITRATNAEASIAGTVTVERTRALAAETNLQTSITTEVNRALAAESTIAGSVTTETNRATTAEGVLSTRITTEVTRATGIEGGLRTDINNEISRALAADAANTAAITTEVNRAQTAEGSLSTRITNEVNRATAQENADRSNMLSLTNSLRIDLQNEVTRALTQESALFNDYVARDGSIIGSLNSEINRATSQENSIYNQFITFANKFASGSNANGTFETRANGIIEQWGRIDLTSTGEPTVGVILPTAFVSNNYNIEISPMIFGSANNKDTWVQVIANTVYNGGFSVQYQKSSGGDSYLDGFYWRAIGSSDPSNTYPGSTVPGGGSVGGGSGGGGVPGGGGGGVIANCPEIITPILLSNEDKTGPGQFTTAGELKIGQYVWTQQEDTLEWGAYRVSGVTHYKAELFRAPYLYRTTKHHKFWQNGEWIEMIDIGTSVGYGAVVKIDVEDAHTYISLDKNDLHVLNKQL